MRILSAIASLLLLLAGCATTRGKGGALVPFAPEGLTDPSSRPRLGAQVLGHLRLAALAEVGGVAAEIGRAPAPHLCASFGLEVGAGATAQ